MADTDNMDTGSNSATTADEDDRKLFVGGLHQDARENDIRDHFSQYGPIDTVTLKTDSATGRSRGFAFVVFKEVSGVDSAVASTNDDHTIKGKKVAVKKAQSKQGKIYVGKLKPDVSDDEVKDFFSQYGVVAAIEQPFDKIKNERKNFCFVTFEREEPAKKLLKEGSVSIKGHELEIKKVTPKPDPRGMMMMGGGGRGGGGAAAPWGGYGGGGWGGYGGGGGWGAGGGGGYGDYWGGGGGYGADPYYGAAAAAGWAGGYGGGWGYGGAGGGGGSRGGYSPAGGKAPRGGGGSRGGAPRGRGVGAGRGQRQTPY